MHASAGHVPVCVGREDALASRRRYRVLLYVHTLLCVNSGDDGGRCAGGAVVASRGWDGRVRDVSFLHELGCKSRDNDEKGLGGVKALRREE